MKDKKPVKKNNKVIKEEASNIAVSSVDVILTLPIASTIKSIAKIYTARQEAIFEKKLVAFLNHTSKITQEQKQAFDNLLAKDQESFYDKLWMLIDQLDDTKKANMIGAMFRSTLAGKLSVEDFLELSDTVKRIYIVHLKSFHHEYAIGNNLKNSEPKHRFHLSQQGLIKVDERGVAGITPIGKKILDYLSHLK